GLTLSLPVQNSFQAFFLFSEEMDRESALEAIYEDDLLDNENFMSDVEMADASEDAPSEDGELKQQKQGFSGLPNSPENDLEKIINNSKHGTQSKCYRKKKRKKKRKNDNSIGNVNRFVINTCRQLREPKSYLIWEAIRKLGVLAVKQFVAEVFTIENRGGQMTADGKRRRTPGGILWNILKSREPEAYKEIMLKGKEFEKQLIKENSKYRANEFGGQPNSKRIRIDSVDSGGNDGNQTTESTFRNFSQPFREEKPEINLQENSWQGPLVKAWVDGIKKNNAVLENGCKIDNVQGKMLSEKVKLPVKDRIRIPVGYDDLFVEDTTDIEVKREENGHVQDAI
ncbi:hypothetical protein KI387_014857, partial [Taxus chinensis]